MVRTPIHPGEHLREDLEVLGMSAAELSFGSSAEFWINLQGLYELRLAQEKATKTIDRLPTLKREAIIPA